MVQWTSAFRIVGNATAAEITELAKIASAAVKAKFGIELQPEVNLVGITW